MVDDYLQELVEEGELDSHGCITLDPAQARKKLADHRFLHCLEGLMALISANLLAAATQVRVHRDGRLWEFLSDGHPATPEQLDNLLRDLFRAEQPQQLRELGLAINCLYPKHCDSVKVQVGERWASFASDGSWKLHTETVPALPPPFAQKISVQQHKPWSQLWEWFKTLWHPSDNLRLLRRRTRWSPAPILFEEGGGWVSSYDHDPPQAPRGALAMIGIDSTSPALRLPAYQAPPDLFHFERRSRAKSSLRCALLPGDPGENSLLLVYRGLTLAHHQVRSSVFHFEGVLNTESLDLDAGRRQIVPNQRLRQRAETVRQWVNEGAAAWIQQLDPENLSDDLRETLFAAVLRLTPAKALAKLEAALARLPLLALSDGVGWTSLDALRASLKRFEAIHFSSRGPALLHERPLLRGDAEGLKPLSKLLGTTLLDSQPWVGQLQGSQPHYDPSQDYLASTLVGADFEAQVHLPLHFQSGNRLVMLRQGQPFHSTQAPLFEHVPCSFHVFLDGCYDGRLDRAQDRVLESLRQQILDKTEEWLDQMQKEADQGQLARLHDEIYCSLLCLTRNPAPHRHRKIKASRLEYPVVIASPTGDQITSLSQLLASPEQLQQRFSRHHPIRQWLAREGLAGP